MKILFEKNRAVQFDERGRVYPECTGSGNMWDDGCWRGMCFGEGRGSIKDVEGGTDCVESEIWVWSWEIDCVGGRGGLIVEEVVKVGWSGQEDCVGGDGTKVCEMNGDIGEATIGHCILLDMLFQWQ